MAQTHALRTVPNPARAASLPRPLAWLGPRALLFGVAFAVCAAVSVQPMRDPDFYWHLTTGAWIVQHHALPVHDLYTYTVPGHRWLDHEWLSEVLIYFLYRAGGLALLSVVFGLVTLLGMACLFAAAGGFERPYPVMAVVMVLAAFALRPILGPRIQMLTFALACLELLWLRRYLAGRGRWLLALPALTAIWANLHAGFVIAFAFLGLAAGAELAQWARARAGAGPAAAGLHLRRLRTLVLVGAGSALAALATPHGLQVWLYPFQTEGSAAQQALIGEWATPDFHNLAFLPLELVLLALVAACAVRRPSLYDLGLCLFTLALALYSQRHLVFFVAAATPVLAAAGAALWKRHLPPGLVRARGAASSRAAAGVSLAALLAAGFVIMAAAASQLATQETLTAQENPVGAAGWLAAHPELGHRIFNEYSYAGYLEYRFYPDPDRRVFIFGEASVMGDRLLRDYTAVAHLEPDWRQVLDRYGVDCLVIEKGSPLDDVMAGEPGWRLAYSDATSAVYVRDGQATAPTS